MSCELENGSDGGRLAGVSSSAESEVDAGLEAGGSLSSLTASVIVGWKRPPYLLCAERCVGRV